jgi:hypothetical protein
LDGGISSQTSGATSHRSTTGGGIGSQSTQGAISSRG